MTAPRPTAPSTTAIACLVAIGLAAAIQVPLHAGWLVEPTSRILANPFAGTHVWAADVVSTDIWHLRWPDPTSEAGFPLAWRARYVAVPVLVVAALLHPLLSAGVVVSAATLLGPALGGGAMVLLGARLQPGASPVALVVGGLLYGLAPVTLGAALSGQVENTQSWVLPLLAWGLLWAAQPGRSPWVGAPLVGLLWGAGALTSPYLAMLAAILLPWIAWLRGPRAVAIPALAGLLAVGGVGLLLDPGGFDAGRDLFHPSYARSGWPELWSAPLSVADLDTLVAGAPEVQPKAMVMHQPYLGLALLAGALLLGGRRRIHAPVVVAGVLLALGPVLGWRGHPLIIGGEALQLPAVALRWLGLPLAHGGQYYRCMLLAHLGLAAMITASPRPRWLPLVALLGAADALRSVSALGLPWPTVDLPVAVWREWAADEAPGAVLHLPMFSPNAIPCNPVRLAGHAVHGRPLSDMPRFHKEAPPDTILERVDDCTRRGKACDPPSPSELARAGFRYAVIDLPDVPERLILDRRLCVAWGEPDGRDGTLAWWRLEPAPDQD